jgi:hypothetical protein
VAEGQPGGAEAAGAVPDQVDDGLELVGHDRVGLVLCARAAAWKAVPDREL